MTNPSAIAALVGTTIRGKYRVDAPLGAGGMGFVLRARHLKLDQDVALKLLRPDARNKPAVVARFAREARAAARLKNEHVVRILDVDEDDDGTPFFVMEYLRGQDLEQLLQRSGPLEPARAVDIVLQACEAVAEAHALGMVHRDIKPANLFVLRARAGGDHVKLLDFGITKEEAREDVSLTSPAAVVGSPLYMSPEQLKASKDVDARTDIWSLGVVLYQALTNALPFDGANAGELGAQIASEPPTSLLERRSDLPPALVEAVEKCLSKKRDDRFETAVDLARAIAPFGPDGADGASSRVMRVARGVPIDDPALKETQPDDPIASDAAPKAMRVTESIVDERRTAEVSGASSEDLAKTTGSPNVRSVPPPSAPKPAATADEAPKAAPGPRLFLVAAGLAAVAAGAFLVATRSPSTSDTAKNGPPGSGAPSTAAIAASASPATSALPLPPVVPSTSSDAERDAAAPTAVASTARLPAPANAGTRALAGAASATATKKTPPSGSTATTTAPAVSSPSSPLDIDLK